MWDEPYLETCCRSALHRPAGLKDGPCLERLAGMGFAILTGGRFHATDAGRARHSAEIVKRRAQS